MTSHWIPDGKLNVGASSFSTPSQHMHSWHTADRFIALTLPLHFYRQVDFILRVFAYLIFIGAHWTSRITPLSPNEWETGTPLCSDARYACQRDTLIIPHYASLFLLSTQQRLGLIQEGGLSSPP